MLLWNVIIRRNWCQKPVKNRNHWPKMYGWTETCRSRLVADFEKLTREMGLSHIYVHIHSCGNFLTSSFHESWTSMNLILSFPWNSPPSISALNIGCIDWFIEMLLLLEPGYTLKASGGGVENYQKVLI